jgi:hypothetical protein
MSEQRGDDEIRLIEIDAVLAHLRQVKEGTPRAPGPPPHCPNCGSTSFTERPYAGSEIHWFKCDACRHVTPSPSD